MAHVLMENAAATSIVSTASALRSSEAPEASIALPSLT
jgi:hypothetical protein